MNVFPDLGDQLFISALENVGGTVLLVGCDEVRVQDGGKWLDLLKISLELLNQSWLQNFGAFARVVKIQVGNVPTADFEVDRVDHGKQVLDSFVHVLEVTGFLVELEPDVGGCALSERAVEV